MQLVPYSRIGRSHVWLSFALLISLSFAIGACRSASTLEPEQSGPMVKTTIAGLTVDEAGKPVANVAISAHGQTTFSNEFGYFVLPNVMVPKDRAVVLAKQEGYFPSARAATADENGLTEMRLNMMSYGVRKSVNASSGGTVSASGISGTASVKFEPNGMTVNGNPYSGEARVAVRYLDPAEANFASFFSGDEAAVRESGESAMLVSYGVLRVDMRTPSGEMIQPASGKPAEIIYPVPSTLVNPPASIPLWHFDEVKGMWVEEGVATKQGSNYVGTVKHFTDWNLDVPNARFARITGKVMCNGRGIPGVVVRIGQVSAISGKGGLYTRRVPADTEFDVQVLASENDDMYASEAIDVPAIPEGEERLVNLLLSTGCPATVSGTLVNESGTKIPGTVVWVRVNGTVRAATALDGEFEMMAPPGTRMDLSVTSWACGVKKMFTADAGVPDSRTDLGNLIICSDAPTEGDIDISAFATFRTHAVLSPDGQFVAITGHAPVMIVRNAKTGQFVSSTPFAQDSGFVNAPQFSQDGSKYMVSGYFVRDRKALVIETSTGKVLREFPSVDSACFFPDGKSVLASKWEGNAKIMLKYSIETGVAEVIYDMVGIQDRAGLIAISADGKRAVLKYDGTFYSYDLEGKKKLNEVTVPQFVYTYEASSDALKVAYIDHIVDEIVVVDLVTGGRVSSNGLKLPGGVQEHFFTLHPNGKDVLFQRGESKAVVLVNFATGENTKSLSVPFQTVQFGHMSISRDGKKASGIYLDKNQKLMLRVWDL